MLQLKTASTRRAKRRDKIARWVITLGGVTVITSVVAILALIVGVTIPLFRSPRASVVDDCRLPDVPSAAKANGTGGAGAVGAASKPSSSQAGQAQAQPQLKGERTQGRTATTPAEGSVLRLGVDRDMDGTNITGFVWSKDGTVAWVDLRAGTVIGQTRVTVPGDAGSTLCHVESLDATRYSLAWSDGGATLVGIERQKAVDVAAGGPRYTLRSLASLKGTEVASADAGAHPADAAKKAPSAPLRLEQAFIRRSEAGAITGVSRLSDGTIVILRQVTAESLGGDEEVSTYRAVLRESIIPHIRAMAMDRDGGTLYAGTDDGRLVRWKLDEKGEVAHKEVVRAFPDGRAVTALALVLGEVSLAVGDETGELTIWFPVSADGTRKLQLVHRLQPHKAAIREIVPSGRTKSIVSVSADGAVHLDNTTSERHLLSLAVPDAGQASAPQVALGMRGDTLLTLDGSGELITWQIENGCPEISLKTLFGKVLYEGYDRPEYVWQTTGGEDFEPKYSLVPLIFGTLKGTCYAMFFAVPLALFGAMYVSYFTTPGFRNAIKPIVEVMATLPSVVIGFLIALWLAPVIANWLLAFFLSLVVVPVTFVAFMALWRWLRRFDLAKVVENGYEFLVMLLLVLPVGVGIAVCLASPLERGLFFGGTAEGGSLAAKAAADEAPVVLGVFRATTRWQVLAFLACFVTIPATLLASRAIWPYLAQFDWAKRIDADAKGRVGPGKQLPPLRKSLLLLSGIAVGALVAMWAATYLESWLFPANFSGSFRQWLYRGPLGMQYDQRNCIIIAFGLGFAVIPIIFSIAEDSLSNVPYSMTAASMAVGASRWQTLWRVVLPSASPGIFAATMIGFGRAVGETMILLMGSGNTPFLDWSPFNGMRALSANIAVEIPEAPVDGTLYRVLFLCAVLLFVLTFTVNTAAELVRQRLRKRYGKF